MIDKILFSMKLLILATGLAIEFGLVAFVYSLLKKPQKRDD